MMNDSVAIPTNIGLGQLVFGTNVSYDYNCPEWVIALLNSLNDELLQVMWNINQEEYESPFYNTGNSFVCETFEVHAYNWNEEEGQSYNFKYNDIEISWYKHFKRGTTINKMFPPHKYIEMYDNCLQAIRKLEESVNYENYKEVG